MKKTKNGFTLLELLVVIALIGIFAGIVMVALNSSRLKGKDSAIKGNLGGLRSQAQLYFTNNNNFAPTQTTDCSAGIFIATKANQGFAEALVEIEKQNDDAVALCAAAETTWAISSPLHDETSWCVDHQGSSKTGTVDTDTGSPTFATCI